MTTQTAIFTPVDKIGFVRRFALHLENDPENVAPLETLLERQTYFTVVVSDAPDADTNPVEFRLVRTVQSGVTDMSQGQYPLAVTWQGVSMAIIATVKEALVAGKKVHIHGVVRLAGTTMLPSGPRYHELRTLEIEA
jgi:hypothetical protein